MPTKKTTATHAAKKPVVTKKEVGTKSEHVVKKAPQAVNHDHSLLESDIAKLKKEVDDLKSALAALVSASKQNKDPLPRLREIDPRLDNLLRSIKKSSKWTEVRTKVQSFKF